MTEILRLLYGQNAVYEECHRSTKLHRTTANSETQ